MMAEPRSSVKYDNVFSDSYNTPRAGDRNNGSQAPTTNDDDLDADRAIVDSVRLIPIHSHVTSAEDYTNITDGHTDIRTCTHVGTDFYSRHVRVAQHLSGQRRSDSAARCLARSHGSGHLDGYQPRFPIACLRWL
jgi:hypothetical protein